ncbi:MAG: Smr/MutS family protein [Rhodospirillaceae bacterium]
MTARRRSRRALSADEDRLWRLVTKSAVPLDEHARALFLESLADDEDGEAPAPPTAPPPPAVAKPAQAPAWPLPEFAVGQKATAPPVQVRTVLPGLEHGESPGVDKRTAQRFKRGRMEIDATIDLHGMTQEAAHIALNRFVTNGAATGKRCLLVITGKGTRGEGVLRRAVPRWLNDERLRGLILSYSHAQPHHGGQGALYVLLKRRRDA